MKMIHTSSPEWLKEALEAYTHEMEFKIIDDAEIGLDSKDVRSAVNLIAFAKKSGRYRWKQISQVLASLGITGAGIWIIAAAIADPEPTSKLGLLIAGGLVLAVTGSLGTLRALGMRFSVSVKTLGREFHIRPE